MSRMGLAKITALSFVCIAAFGVSVAPAAPPAAPASAPPGMPALHRDGAAIQLVVDGKPFLMLGGELANSSAASAAYLDTIWPRLKAMHLNTVLAPVYWELIEPVEGKYDFSSVGAVIDRAREHGMRVVLLWFGSWKNGMSSYAPGWIKRDTVRFPRAELTGGRPVEALSAFAGETAQVDARAFAELMRYLRRTDGTKHTVLMVQVENEVALIDETADRSAAAAKSLAGPVPVELTTYLAAHRATLAAPLAQAWQAHGARATGTWTELFGPGGATEELFMAWHFARFVERVTAAGKAEYALPMFVNAALNKAGAKPGQYPSGGPLPHLIDVWRAAAPSIDFLSPDIYFPNFADWVDAYKRVDNPLFVPEARNEPVCAMNGIYAIGAHAALGFSPFAVESIETPATSPLAASYGVLTQLAPLILAHQGRGEVDAVLLDKDNPRKEIKLGKHRVLLRHDFTWEWAPPARNNPVWPRAAALIISTGPGEYVMAGSGVIATFAPEPAITGASGIDRIEEGRYENGKWIPGRRLNGDENHQGRHLRLPTGEFGIQRIWLYP